MQTNLQLYLKGSTEALELYLKAFGGTLGYSEKNPDGTYIHAEIYIGDCLLLALSEGDDHRSRGNIMQYSVSFQGDGDAVAQAYRVLREGGRILNPLGPCRWSKLQANLYDKFGVLWYITI